MPEETEITYPIRAYADKRFIRRYLLIALACVGVILWCVYDLQVKYPRELERSKYYHDQLLNMDAASQSTEWTRITEEKGWSKTAPDKLEIIQGHIQFQYWIGGVCIVAGLSFLIYYLRTLKSYVEADQKGLTTSWGKSFQYSQIEYVDKRRWEKKGIAKIVYKKNKDDEMERTFLLDDLKYQRTPVDQILETIEAALSDDQIRGGISEVEARRRRQAIQAAAEKE